jgi:hypothetical protein
VLIASHIVVQTEDEVWVFLETQTFKDRSRTASPPYSRYPHMLHAFLVDETGVRSRISLSNDGSIALNANLSHLFAHNDDICLLNTSTRTDDPDKKRLLRWGGTRFVPLDADEVRAVLEALPEKGTNLEDVSADALDLLTSKDKWTVVAAGHNAPCDLHALNGRLRFSGDAHTVRVSSQNGAKSEWEEVLLDTTDIDTTGE